MLGERKDTTPPTTTAILNGTNGQPSWFRSDVQFSLNAEDNDLGVYYTVYKTNEGEWEIYDSPLNFTSEGHYKVEFYSVDNDENRLAAQFRYFAEFWLNKLNINSGFRSGSSKSDHGVGLAADLNITNNGTPITETQRVAVMNWILSNLKSKVRQILFEKGSAKSPLGWIHLAAQTPTMGDRGASTIGTMIGPSYAFLPGLPGSNGYTLLS